MFASLCGPARRSETKAGHSISAVRALRVREGWVQFPVPRPITKFFIPMLSMNDLKKGTLFIFEGQPYVVLEAAHLKMGRGGSVLQTKIKNLMSGSTVSRNFKQADKFEEADVQRKKYVFLYEHRGEYCFVDENDKSKRVMLSQDQVGSQKNFLKPQTSVEIEFFGDEILRIVLPIKMDLKVTEAPPSIKGDTAQGGTKAVTLETGAIVQTPLFVNMGDTVRVNTESGEYVERVEKG